jgi:hypothetical protein
VVANSTGGVNRINVNGLGVGMLQRDFRAYFLLEAVQAVAFLANEGGAP